MVPHGPVLLTKRERKLLIDLVSLELDRLQASKPELPPATLDEKNAEQTRRVRISQYTAIKRVLSAGSGEDVSSIGVLRERQ